MDPPQAGPTYSQGHRFTRGLWGPDMPYGPHAPINRAKKSRHSKLILRAEGLNRSASITLKLAKNVWLASSGLGPDSCPLTTGPDMVDTNRNMSQHALECMDYTVQSW